MACLHIQRHRGLVLPVQLNFVSHTHALPAGSLAEAKAALLYAVAGTERGGDAEGLQRGMVEEAQVGPLNGAGRLRAQLG